MKKYSKLIAVLLAIAVVICPMISVVASADGAPSGTYKLEQVDGDTVKLTIDSTEGFLVYKAVINSTKTLSNLAVESYEVKSPATKNEYNLPAISQSTSGSNTTILVSATEGANCDLYTQVVITMDVATGADVKLTNIQAADDGDVDGQGNLTDATLLDFPGVENASDGDIDPTADDYPADDAVVENVHAHVATTTVPAAAATCSATGTQGYVYCATCEKYFTNNTFATETTVAEREIAIDPTAHSYGEYNYDGNATCTEDGTKTRVCANNPAHKDTVPDTGTKLGHSFTTKASGEQATPADCDDAATYYVQCDRCDEVDHTKTVAVGAANGHSFTTLASSTVKTPATCTAAAVYYVQCDNCTTVSDTETVSVGAPLEHNYVWDGNVGDGQHTVVCQNGCEDSKPEPCDTNGTGGACSVCGYKAAPAHTHNWVVDAASYVAPSDTATGSVHLTCLCGESDDKVVTYTKGYRFTVSSLELRSEIVMGFQIPQYNYNYYGAVDKGFAIFSRTTDVSPIASSIDSSKFGVSGSNYVAQYKIGSTQMANVVSAYLLVLRADGNYYGGSLALTFSVGSFIKGNFDGADPTMQRLYADLLKYGDAAQAQFPGATDISVLPTSYLTSAQLEKATSTTPSFSNSVKAGLGRSSSSSDEVFVDQTAIELQSKILFKDRVSMKYYQGGDTSVRGAVRMVATFTDGWGNDQVFTYYNPDNTDNPENALTYTHYMQNNAVTPNHFVFSFDDFTAVDMRTPITVSFYNGDNLVGPQFVYSVEAFVYDKYTANSDDTVLVNLLMALLKYGDSARAAFAS